MKQMAASMQDGGWVVSLPAQLSANTEEPLLAVVREGLEHSPRILVLDMSRVRLTDTAGIGTLVTTVHLATEAGVPVALAGAEGRPRILLDRVQFARYARVCGTVAEALAGTEA